jgi:hypothetical protein
MRHPLDSALGDTIWVGFHTINIDRRVGALPKPTERGRYCPPFEHVLAFDLPIQFQPFDFLKNNPKKLNSSYK